VRERAFSMPLTSPANPPGPYHFRQREYLITYRTDREKLRERVRQIEVRAFEKLQKAIKAKALERQLLQG
jgi:acetoacetate decarboxylase